MQIDIKSSKKPCLAILHANDRMDSQVYVKNKMRAIEKIGFSSLYFKFDSCQVEALREKIAELNMDNSVHGILLQAPVYESWLTFFDDFINSISSLKDIDGMRRDSLYEPCTAGAVIAILDHYKLPIKGQHAVVIGRSRLVGEPIARSLLARGATVSILHKHTDLQTFNHLISQADMIISAVGKPKLLKASAVKRGAVIIDVGITSYDDKICGDVEHDGHFEYSYTPVPGGVGPVTVAKLMENLHLAYRKQTGLGLEN